MISRTEGNPFFLEESVRALVETGVVAGERGSFRLAKSFEAIQVPATVQAVLAARIDRLPTAAKHLLQSAAVIGKTVPFTLLATVAEVPATELRRGLTQLQAAEFLYESTLFPELEYTFKHALTLEVGYQTLLRERRRLLYTRVLSALEQSAGDAASENVEVLAHHAVHGKAWASAAAYLYRAGAKAQAEARYAAAMTFYERGIDVVNRVGPTGDRGLELDAYLELWSTRISTGHVDGLGELGNKVEALARALDDGPRLARVQVRQAQAIALAAAIPGTLHSALERAREAAMRADAADLRTRSYARFIAAVACRDIGQIEVAVAEYDRGVDLFASAGDVDAPGLVYPIFVSLCGWRAEAQAALGHFDAALVSASEALRVATRIRHPSSLSIANAFLGYVHLLQGDLPAALDVLERGLAISEEHDLVHGICANAVYLGWATILTGNRSDGLDYLARGFERPAGAVLQWTRFGTVTAAAYLDADRTEEARRVIADSLSAAAERDAQGYHPALARLDAEVRLCDGDAASAQQRARESLAAAITLGMTPEVARCHATLGRIAARLGESTAAAEHRAAARQIFGELGSTFWAARVANG